jgi:tetratricopeptide (TPR) repeat protein
VKFGTPNSCVACHDDKDNNWAAEAVNKWYGTKRKPHFSDLLLKTREQPMLAFAEAMKFVVKAEEPAIVRATILRDYAGMSSENEDILKAVIACLKDSDPLMRHTAASAIQEWPPQLRFTLAPPLCADRLRSVRVAAAALMVDMPEKAIDEKFKVPYEKAKKEYLASLKFNADFASGQMNIGNYHLKLREVDKAIEAYEESLTIDNRFNPARMNLARIYSGQGQNDKALKLLEKVVEQEPKFWGGWYSLGLLYNELKRLPDAEAALKKSAKLSNGHPNAYANWGLSLQGLERRAEAAEAFKAGLALAPGHPNLLDKLSIVYIQMKKWQEAEKAVLQLIRQFPQNQEFRGRLNWLQQQK